MHMANTLLSPVVGGAMTVVSGGAAALSIRSIQKQGFDKRKIPLMGIAGSFVFAAQMINFTIPGTGASGHISGGIFLAALLGPMPALLVMAAILLVQCLLFADGGLLAYGCNVFNLGVMACLVVYPLVFRPLVRGGMTRGRLTAASLLACLLGLQAGAFGVTVQTTLSGVTELPFAAFAALMQPIHLAIGLVEGIVTAAVLLLIHNTRPVLLSDAAGLAPLPETVSFRRVAVILLAAALVTGGLISLMASEYPDGLEWSIAKITGQTEPETQGAVYDSAEQVVDSTALFPDYDFRGAPDEGSVTGTTVSGVAGSLVILLLCGGMGVLFSRRKKMADNT